MATGLGIKTIGRTLKSPAAQFGIGFSIGFSFGKEIGKTIYCGIMQKQYTIDFDLGEESFYTFVAASGAGYFLASTAAKNSFMSAAMASPIAAGASGWFIGKGIGSLAGILGAAMFDSCDEEN